MGWWRAFDPREVGDELAHIADMGFGYVRFFLLWEEFQPEAHRVSFTALDNLGVVLDAAAAVGLRTCPTLFTGNMSGALWYPAWVMDEESSGRGLRFIVAGGEHSGRVRDFYEDSQMLEAQRLLIREVVGSYAQHPAVWGWDVGNESDEGRRPRSYEVGKEWGRSLLEYVRELDPNAHWTYGAHQGSLDSYNGLRVDHLAEICDPISIHAYPIYSQVARGSLDVEFARYVVSLTESLGGKPVLLQEFGFCTARQGEKGQIIEDDFVGKRWPLYLASEEEQAQYIKAVLEGCYQMGTVGAWVWCYADYAEALWVEPPFNRAIRERTFGLVRRDGTEKPAAQVVRTFARRLAGNELGQASRGKRLLEVDPDEYYRDPGSNFGRYYNIYLEGQPQASHREQGEPLEPVVGPQ